MATGDNNPNQWLGLLKWSLAYTDGTQPSGDATQSMSKEDVEFLEKVMKEGIIDEGERMKSILSDLTDGLGIMLGTNKQEEKLKELEEDEMLELLQELRDIVEQIDYARAFMAMGGIPFLLGCATYESNDANKSIPKSIRKGALGVLSTMCQNNPPVQPNLLEHGHMPQLIQLFFDYAPGNDYGNDVDDSIREKTMQALSASIRGHAIAEEIFCKNPQGKVMLQVGLGMQQPPKPSAQLRKRSLFLLRALLTSDNASVERHEQFRDVISYICTHEINKEFEEDAELREMSLAMLSQLLRHKPPPRSEESSSGCEHASKIILEQKSSIVSVGIRAIQAIRDLKEGGEEREYASLELEEWENLMVTLSEAEEEEGRKSNGVDPPLAICDIHVSE